MFDLAAEFEGVLAKLAEHGIEYAVCGGMAMALHGYLRATVDIDLLIRPEDEERIYAAVEPFGYIFRANPMRFDKGAMEIRRVTKLVEGDPLMLDLLLVTEQSEHVWQGRWKVTWRGKPVSVVSPEGLIALKLSRSSLQDLADIERLRSGE
jgi:Uncharacterised nucleotidyltransferase